MKFFLFFTLKKREINITLLSLTDCQKLELKQMSSPGSKILSWEFRLCWNRNGRLSVSSADELKFSFIPFDGNKH